MWQNNDSRMFFDNCVIIGNGDAVPLMFLRHGSASFRQCTLLNAGILNRGAEDNRGTLSIEHSLIGGMGTALMDIPAGMEKRVMLSGNLYFGDRGFRVAGKQLLPGEAPGSFDVNSQWYDGKPAGRLEAERPGRCGGRTPPGKNGASARRCRRVSGEVTQNTCMWRLPLPACRFPADGRR